MQSTNSTPLGIIEGFFGRPWSWQARADYARFLAAEGYQFYVYAPKSDVCLRRSWAQDWSQSKWAELKALREVYRQYRVDFGIGLSPFEIYLEPGDQTRRKLRDKIAALNKLQPDILCLLFDDMRGDLPQLAHQQIELVKVAADTTNAKRIIFCPTYYSFDPILEQVFGSRPAGYWEQLGKELDSALDIFWTGPKVCSGSFPAAHLRHVTELLQRRPFLWDNYPVNDSARLSNHLHLRAFGEDRAQLNGLLAGHAANPMNQPYLSQIPLTTLSRAYRGGQGYDPAQALIGACHQLCEPELARQLLKDLPLLQDIGLNGFTAEDQKDLQESYRPFINQSDCARELLDWLAGEYAFDPACLTQ